MYRVTKHSFRDIYERKVNNAKEATQLVGSTSNGPIFFKRLFTNKRFCVVSILNGINKLLPVRPIIRGDRKKKRFL